MAYSISSPVKITLVAAADLSGQQSRFVKLTADGRVEAVTATTDRAIGVLENKPKAGQEAEISVVGTVKMIASAALAVGTSVVPAADGRAAAQAAPAAGTTVPNYGTVLLANTAANGYVTVVVNAANISRFA